MTDNRTHEDPTEIERDIRRTQDEMGRTVDRLGDQLTIKNVFNALLDKADENGVDAHYLVDGARRNPVALGLIAAGAIWLVSDKDSKFPSMSSRNKSKRPEPDELELHGHDVHHRDYVSHMSSLEMREGEDPLVYQRRRDLHRAAFLMCEQRPDEDDRSFRQRLDDMTEKFREKRRAWSESAGRTSSAAKRRTQQLAGQASTKAQDFYGSNPLVGGMLAAAAGAALGSAIPVTRQEQDKLGGIGQRAREMASEQKEQLTSKAMEKKDELLEKADQKLQQESQQPEQGQPTQSQQPERAFAETGSASSPETNYGNERRSPAEGPFIITDRES